MRASLLLIFLLVLTGAASAKAETTLGRIEFRNGLLAAAAENDRGALLVFTHDVGQDLQLIFLDRDGSQRRILLETGTLNAAPSVVRIDDDFLVIWASGTGAMSSLDAARITGDGTSVVWQEHLGDLLPVFEIYARPTAAGFFVTTRHAREVVRREFDDRGLPRSVSQVLVQHEGSIDVFLELISRDHAAALFWADVFDCPVTCLQLPARLYAAFEGSSVPASQHFLEQAFEPHVANNGIEAWIATVEYATVQTPPAVVLRRLDLSGPAPAIGAEVVRLEEYGAIQSFHPLGTGFSLFAEHQPAVGPRRLHEIEIDATGTVRLIRPISQSHRSIVAMSKRAIVIDHPRGDALTHDLSVIRAGGRQRLVRR